MKSKIKVKTKWADKVTWQFCNNCGHPIMGITTVNAKIGWPGKVKVPKKVKKPGFNTPV